MNKSVRFVAASAMGLWTVGCVVSPGDGQHLERRSESVAFFVCSNVARDLVRVKVCPSLSCATLSSYVPMIVDYATGPGPMEFQVPQTPNSIDSLYCSSGVSRAIPAKYWFWDGTKHVANLYINSDGMRQTGTELSVYTAGADCQGIVGLAQRAAGTCTDMDGRVRLTAAQ
jgi:hypothetical protein